MRLSSLFSALTPSFLSPKKSQSEDARVLRGDSKNAPSRQASVPSQLGPVPGDEEAIARLTSQLASDRQRAIAARGRTETQWQRLLPQVPTDLPDAAKIQVARRIKWLEQALPLAPTHLPSHSEPAKKPAASRQRPGAAKSSVGRNSKRSIKKLIADKRQKLELIVKERDAMRHELDALMSATKRKGENMSPLERLMLQQKAQTLMKMAPVGPKLLAEIHALEHKLRVA